MPSSKTDQGSLASCRAHLARGGATALLLAWVFLFVQCESVVPRNGWNEVWGPLVPHHTFPGDCGLCHYPERWDELKPDFKFDHARETGYALTGSHAQAACLRCHNDRGPVSAYVERGCGGCHVDPHQSTLGLDCGRCHEERTWRPVGLIAEHARTRFPLLGAHVAVPCERCHERAPVGEYRGAPVACDLCHQDELARATSPDHVASGWTRDCERCHTTTTWTRASFAHAYFPLTGGHRGVDCTRCHTSGTFGPIPSDCYSCHQDDYERAPNHVASGYSRDCTRCHSTRDWSGASFAHDFFPLRGGHSGLACTSCHTSGNFGPIPRDCNSCHADDYQRAPNHVALGYPTDCAGCHNTTSWSGARFDHRFPLRGPHDVDCTMCHDAGSTTTFTCLVCHEHSQSNMANDHDEVRGYSYTSTACYSCHPNGTH